MKNKAKCKLCNEVLESFHEFDYVSCKCGEISISGGSIRMECSAKDWKNFVRVDEAGNEIPVKVIEKNQPLEKNENTEPLNRDQLIESFEFMVKNLENLPQNALSTPISHFDLYSFLIHIVAILKSEK